MKEVTVSKQLNGRRIDTERPGTEALQERLAKETDKDKRAKLEAEIGKAVRLGSPEAGLAAVDFDETGTPIQVRRASSVQTRDLRGVNQSFEEVPIIGQKPKRQAEEAVSDDEFYNGAGVNRRQTYEGEEFVEDTNPHQESVDAAEAKPSGRTAGVVEGQTARSKEDLENMQRQVDKDVALKDKADKVRKAKTRRNIGLAAIASAGGAYGLLGGDEDSEAMAGDFGLSGSPEEDTNQSSETVGDQVRRARQRRYTLMTPMNPVPW
jgi:hypothetical protein